jgi:hypothetical protein
MGPEGMEQFFEMERIRHESETAADAKGQEFVDDIKNGGK